MPARNGLQLRHHQAQAWLRAPWIVPNTMCSFGHIAKIEVDQNLAHCSRPLSARARERLAVQESYEDLVKLAKICVVQARACVMPEAAAELRHMAKEYQQRAADLDGGKLPDIGEEASHAN